MSHPTKTHPEAGTPVRVATLSDFIDGRCVAHIGEGEETKAIALFQIDGEIHAIANACSHLGGPLCDGEFDEQGYIVCPWHGYQYDPKTGKAPPGFSDSVESFKIVVRGNEVFLDPQPVTERSSHDYIDLAWKPPVEAKHPVEWLCLVCHDSYTGTLPPAVCTKCKAPHELIFERPRALPLFTQEELDTPTYPVEEGAAVAYLVQALKRQDLSSRRLAMYRSLAAQPPVDVLVISGSAHSNHVVSGFIAPSIVRRVQAQDPELRVEWIDLAKYRIDHNWACYSLSDDFCRFPCNNMDDDMRKLYPAFLKARSIMVCTPINWENMNSRLKVFLDRLTNLQDIPLKVGRSDFAGRPVGVFVNGHEDGAYKVAWDVFVHFQNMGFVLAPFGIWYNLSSLTENTAVDLDRVRSNETAILRLEKVVDNVVAFMRLRVDTQLRIHPEGEKLRSVQYVAM